MNDYISKSICNGCIHNEICNICGVFAIIFGVFGIVGILGAICLSRAHNDGLAGVIGMFSIILLFLSVIGICQ